MDREPQNEIETLEATAVKAAQEYGIMTPAITRFANGDSGEEGFILELRGANLELTQSVHVAMQEKAISTGHALKTRTLPGKIQVYWKKK